MGLLREALTKAGLTDVRTYIQSGNVLARSSLSVTQVERLVHDEIRRHFGGDLAVIARTPAQVQHILSKNPFQDLEMSKVYFVILSTKPDKGKTDELSDAANPPSRCVIADGVAYLYCPDGYSNSKVNGNFLEKRLGLRATMRNFNTMTKLVELADALQ